MDENEIDEEQALIQLLQEDKRFTAETYVFVNEVLDCAQQLGVGEMKRSEQSDGSLSEEEDPHITGGDLCRIAVSYAVAQYGMLARTVLEQLGLRTTGDIGDVVYNMIRVGLMAKTSEDSREDFDDVFDLGAELDSAFEFQYERRRGR